MSSFFSGVFKGRKKGEQELIEQLIRLNAEAGLVDLNLRLLCEEDLPAEKDKLGQIGELFAYTDHILWLDDLIVTDIKFPYTQEYSMWEKFKTIFRKYRTKIREDSRKTSE